MVGVNQEDDCSDDELSPVSGGTDRRLRGVNTCLAS